MTASASAPPSRRQPRAGIDRLLADEIALARLRGMRVGLLANHASTTAWGEPAARALQRALAGGGAGGLVRLFAPEHGSAVQTPAGAPVGDAADPLTGLACTSLYGAREGLPAAALAALDGLDAVAIDLRDVGVRCYTYAATAALLAEAALARGIEVVVCDRANPHGPAAAGPRPDPGAAGGLLCFFDVPFVHGLTLAGLLARRLGAGRAGLTVFPADAEEDPPPLGWTGPSPALAHPHAVALYPGLVLLEGTNVREGRGSACAFRSVSAAGLVADALCAAIDGWRTGFRATPGRVTEMRGDAPAAAQPAAILRPAGKGPRNAFALGVQLLDWLCRHHEGFQWTRGAGGRMTVDILLGTDRLRTGLDAGASADEILSEWAEAGRQSSQDR